MKKLSYIIAAAILFFAGAGVAEAQVSAQDLAEADKFFSQENYSENQKALDALMAKATTGAEKAEILWRMSRIQLILGQDEKTDTGKQAIFGKGISYAEEAIKNNPNNAEGYMWHCANVGRECQTHSVNVQMKALPKMMGDLTTILDKLKNTNHSAAWQALAEIYYNHPFKSNDAAINFTRKAAMCIPKGEIRLSTYILLAKMLYDRNWSADKRASSINSDKARYQKSYSSNIEKYEYFDGSLETVYKHPWSKKGVGLVSDREEARELADYATGLYNGKSVKTKTDNSDYKELQAVMSKWK